LVFAVESSHVLAEMAKVRGTLNRLEKAVEKVKKPKIVESGFF
jgi:hypothetical protein